jgi:hypothetical protein
MSTMPKLLPVLAALLLLAPGRVLPAQPLAPFVANYQVLRGGHAMGEATMRVVKGAGDRWRVDLAMHGTGLIGLAGLNAEQSTVFDTVGQTYRPLTQSTLRKALFTRRQTTGTYDWRSLSARWSGDVKESRRAPVTLQPGDMSGLLINLAVIRDAQPGTVLRYRFVDNGRARDHQYAVATQLETVAVGDIGYNAMRVTRVQGDNEETVIWVVDGVPTPIRMLQRENGVDTYDLRLVDYKGVQ